MAEPAQQPSEFQKFAGKLPLYLRIAFAAFIVFGLVGNCAHPGDVRPVLIFIFTALFWACSRILQEGIDAYRILRMAQQHEESLKKGETKKDDETPPEPPTA
jgi:hypothetical protein